MKIMSQIMHLGAQQKITQNFSSKREKKEKREHGAQGLDLARNLAAFAARNLIRFSTREAFVEQPDHKSCLLI